MKICVNEIPKEPKECLFAKKAYGMFFCNVNDKRCDLVCGENCRKLKRKD